MMEQSSVIKVHLDNDDGDGGEAEEKARKEKVSFLFIKMKAMFRKR